MTSVHAASQPAKAAALRSIDVFSTCGPKEIDRLCALCDEVRLPAGSVVVGEGTPGNAFFLLVEGTAEVRIGGAWVAGLSRGDFFGEMTLLGAHARTASVTAASALRLLVVKRTRFAEFIREAPSAALMVSREAARRRDRRRNQALL